MPFFSAQLKYPAKSTRIVLFTTRGGQMFFMLLIILNNKAHTWQTIDNKSILLSISPTMTTSRSYTIKISHGLITTTKGTRESINYDSSITIIESSISRPLSQIETNKLESLLANLVKHANSTYQHPNLVMDNWIICYQHNNTKLYFTYGEIRQYPPEIKNALFFLLRLSPIELNLPGLNY